MPVLTLCLPVVIVLSALFGGFLGLLLLAERHCRAGGGRPQDAAWLCDFPAVDPVSLWALLDSAEIALLALLIAVPVGLLLVYLKRRRQSCRGIG